MEKRVLITSDFRPNKNKRCKRYLSLEEEDRISGLPDDILVHMLSYLTVKEAARAGILSTRWKHLWMHTSRLDFDAEEALDKLINNYSVKLREMESCKYVEWGSIDEWVEYAFAKDVHKLELNLLDSNLYTRYFKKSCTFPNPLTLTSPSSDYCGLKNGFKSLRELCLKCVNVSGEVLGCFLHNCPLLERLIVHGSGDLVTLEVSGPALKLKHLEIVFCHNIDFIKVSDTNIVSLIFKSNQPMFSLGFPAACLNWRFLALTISIEAIERMERRNFPELTQLKQLIVVADAEENRSLIGITSLTRVCPFLQKLAVKLRWFDPNRRRRAFKGARRSPLRHLTEFELSGYYGRVSEIELITYVLQNATSLQKITIDPREHFEPHQQRGTREIERVQAARCCAKNQLRVIPQHIDLVIL